MTTIKELEAEIKKYKQEIEDFNDLRKSCEGYAELQDKLYALSREHRDKCSPRIQNRWEWIKGYEAEIKELRLDKSPKYPEHIIKWGRWFGNLYDYGYGGTKIVWLSDDAEFAIITTKGSTAGQGTPMGTGSYYYAETTHSLYSTVYNRSCMRVGGEPVQKGEISGRLTKENKQKLLDLIPALKLEIEEGLASGKVFKNKFSI